MSELRFDPIKQHWVILAGKRARRPSEFRITVESRGEAECPFCPGHEHETPESILTLTDGESAAWTARLIPNKFPAVDQNDIDELIVPSLHEAQEGRGRHEVMIESRKHHDRQAQFNDSHFASILAVYQSRIRVFIDSFHCQHVTVFTNVGYRGGATLNHPHSQIIGLERIPTVIETELRSAEQHYNKARTCLFCEIIRTESGARERVLYETDDFIAFCPYASRFAYEFAIYPKAHHADFRDVSTEGIESLARFLKTCLMAMDVCLQEPDYNVILHTAPARTDSSNSIETAFHWHFEIIPRVSTQAGMEWGTGIHINSFPPEKVAQVYAEAVSRLTHIAR